MRDVKIEQLGRVLSIQLNRPYMGNALTSNMYVTLAKIFNEAGDDATVLAVLLHGAGESFCAGTDMDELFEDAPSRMHFPQAQLMNALTGFDKPIVACAAGAVIGAGITLLTQCDFAYAAINAQFQTAFMNPCAMAQPGSLRSLSAGSNECRGTNRVFRGKPFDAQRAASLGLVACLVADEDLLSAGMDTANKYADMSASSVEAGKKHIKCPFRDQLDLAMKTEGRDLIKKMRSEVAEESLTTGFTAHRSASKLPYIH